MKTNEQTQESEDDDILRRLEEDDQRRRSEAAGAARAADVAIARKLLELRAATDAELFAIGDAGGTFRGIFGVPAPEAWKRWKSEMRNDQARLVANQNLAVACMKHPTADVLAAAAAKRPALYDAIGMVLQERAGAGQEAIVKG